MFAAMKTADFDYDLPRESIAQHPAVPRDSARLLEIRPDRLIDRTVRDLPQCLAAGDVMVVNDTRVIPARIEGTRGAARIEVTLHRAQGGGVWRAFARPAQRLRPGDRIAFGAGLAAEVQARDGGEVTLAFGLADDALLDALARAGHMPLPPYIRRGAGGEARDATDYQTIFAARPGAVAAPTAGLHFTPALLVALQERGIALHMVTLHVGAGTFLPVTAERAEDHRMHAEWGEITAATAEAIDAARARGGRIVAVGTTSLRLLESACDEAGRVHPFAGECDLFILPGYRFRAVDLLLTNFHLPRSTLLMLAAAFAGRERILAAYDHAKRTGYRFYSYGDACLLHPAPIGPSAIAP
jgi:S-adenosylmethionine:tRNA ribosyltransferase-isomerase